MYEEGIRGRGIENKYYRQGFPVLVRREGEVINLYLSKLETCHKLIDYLLITRHKRPLSSISAYTYTHNIYLLQSCYYCINIT